MAQRKDILLRPSPSAGSDIHAGKDGATWQDVTLRAGIIGNDVVLSPGGSLVDVIIAAGPFVYAKSGQSIIGLVTAAADVIEAVESGAVIVGVVSSATDVREAVESGQVTTGLVASAVDVFEASETGQAILAAAASAADVYEPSETGTVALAAVASAADVFEAIEAATAILGAVAAGASVKIGSSIYAKTGEAAVGFAATGADVYEAVEAGAAAVGALLSGVDVFEAVESGAVVIHGATSGTDVAEHIRTATVIIGASASGQAVAMAVIAYIPRHVTADLTADTPVAPVRGRSTIGVINPDLYALTTRPAGATAIHDDARTVPASQPCCTATLSTRTATPVVSTSPAADLHGGSSTSIPDDGARVDLTDTMPLVLVAAGEA